MKKVDEVDKNDKIGTKILKKGHKFSKRDKNSQKGKRGSV